MRSPVEPAFIPIIKRAYRGSQHSEHTSFETEWHHGVLLVWLTRNIHAKRQPAANLKYSDYAHFDSADVGEEFGGLIFQLKID